MTFRKPLGPVALAMASVLCAASPGATALAAIPPDAAVVQPADFSREAKALFSAAWPADGPGAAVVVTRGGEVIYAAGRGLADLDTGRPITPDTPFRLGSIVKQFTAAVVLQLVDEGKISLDDPISRFFPDWPQPGAHATVRQLLNHSSGIQDYTKIPGWMLSEPTMRPNTTADLVAVIRSRPSVSEPGTRWEYNNGGYVMLGAIIEKVTGQAWHEAVVERIARPLGLTSIAYAASEEAGLSAARGYSEQDGRFQPSRGVHISVAHAAGGLVGSASDLAKWAQALHHGRVVSPVLYQEMIRPAVLADGSTETYGFGLRLREIRGRPALVHGGAGRGLDTDSAFVPAEDIYVAVLANTDDPPTDPAAMVRRLAALALGEPFPVFTRAEVDLPATEPLFGAYDAGDGHERRFFARDGKLWLGRGDEEVEVTPAGEDRFFFGPDGMAWFRAERQADGAHVLEVHPPETAATIRAVRTGPVPAALTVAPAVLRTYLGTYATEGPVLTVAMDGNGRLAIGPAGQQPGTLRPVSETEFRLDDGITRVVFHNENGAVDRITLYRGARELHGQRTSR